MKIDFLLPASPTVGFFSQIAFFRLCLNALGGYYKNARLVAVFGDVPSPLPQPWLSFFENIDVEWAGPSTEDKPGFHPQHDRRFEVFRKDADLVIMCDADVAPLRPFDSLITQLKQRPALAGTIAHYEFPSHLTAFNMNEAWSKLAALTIGKAISTPYVYSLLPRNAPPQAPFYINYGVFMGPPELITEFYQRDTKLRKKVIESVGVHWSAQISLALTCADLNLPTLALPMRYNFPNDPIADNLYPEEVPYITFMHYLRLDQFERDKIFSSKAGFDQFIHGNFTGSSEIFRSYVANITDESYPFL